MATHADIKVYGYAIDSISSFNSTTRRLGNITYAQVQIGDVIFTKYLVSYAGTIPVNNFNINAVLQDSVGYLGIRTTERNDWSPTTSEMVPLSTETFTYSINTYVDCFVIYTSNNTAMIGYSYWTPSKFDEDYALPILRESSNLLGYSEVLGWYPVTEAAKAEAEAAYRDVYITLSPDVDSITLKNGESFDIKIVSTNATSIICESPNINVSIERTGLNIRITSNKNITQTIPVTITASIGNFSVVKTINVNLVYTNTKTPGHKDDRVEFLYDMGRLSHNDAIIEKFFKQPSISNS